MIEDQSAFRQNRLGGRDIGCRGSARSQYFKDNEQIATFEVYHEINYKHHLVIKKCVGNGVTHLVFPNLFL